MQSIQASEDLSGAGSSERNTVVDVNSTSHNTTEYDLATFTKRNKRKEVLGREKKGGGPLRTCVILHF